MTDAPAPRPGFRVHPVDLLVLAVAVALACIAYAYLFRRSPVPRPVDRFLGMVLEVDFEADRPWKKDFPVRGDTVTVEDYLVATVLDAGPAPGGPEGVRRIRLRVADRESQKPEAMTLFRTGVFVGTRLRITCIQKRSEVTGEVVSVEGFREAR